MQLFFTMSWEMHLLGTGHFALQSHAKEIASRIEGFLSKNKITR